MTNQPTHGDRREGAGRKALPGGSITAAFVLGKAHMESIRAWAKKHGCRSVSEALRQMIERSTER